MWCSVSFAVSRWLSTSFCSKCSKNVVNNGAPILRLQQNKQPTLLAVKRAPSKQIACSHGKGQPRIASRDAQAQDNLKFAGSLVCMESEKEKNRVTSTGNRVSSLLTCDQIEKQHAMSHKYEGSQQKVNPPHSLEREQSRGNCSAEKPLLFSVESSGYHLALNRIAAAKDAGDLCSSAAARLKDLCHLLHMESVIRAAARPCSNRFTSDDILIRKDGPQHDPVLLDDLQSIKTRGDSCSETTPPTAYCTWATFALHEQSLPSSLHLQCVNMAMPQPCKSPVNESFVDQESHKLFCGGTQKMMESKPSSDGPSKDQLAYMHHRLSDEMPKFFEQHHDYGLYADNVIFDNRVMKVGTRGVIAYKATVQSLKYLLTAYLMRTEMEVLRITMETEQGCVQARWRIKGVPLHSYMLRPWGKKHKLRYFDAFSTFYVGTDGLIHKHVLDKVMPSSDTVAVTSWAVRLGIMLGLVRPPAFDPDVLKSIGLMKSLLSK